MYLHYNVLLIGLKRPLIKDLSLDPSYSLLINPYSSSIDEKDIGIFLVSSPTNLKSLWKNQSLPPNDNNDKSFSNDFDLKSFLNEIENDVKNVESEDFINIDQIKFIGGDLRIAGERSNNMGNTGSTTVAGGLAGENKVGFRINSIEAEDSKKKSIVKKNEGGLIIFFNFY